MKRTTKFLLAVATLGLSACAGMEAQLTPPTPEHTANMQWPGDGGTNHTWEAFLALNAYCDKGEPFGSWVVLTAPVDCVEVARAYNRTYSGSGSDPTQTFISGEIRRLEDRQMWRDIQGTLRANQRAVMGTDRRFNHD